MKLSRIEQDTRIVELYKSGWSFRQLQKRYHRSPNHIAKLVKGIEVTCAMCGKLKGKIRFHTYHPDRLNHPDYIILFCPSCHAKEEVKLRRQKENKSQSPLNTPLPTTLNVAGKPSTTSIPVPLGPLSPIGRKRYGIRKVIILKWLYSSVNCSNKTENCFRRSSTLLYLPVYRL